MPHTALQEAAPVKYTSACLQTITERGRCSRGAPASWPATVTPAQEDVRPKSSFPKLDRGQQQHQPVRVSVAFCITVTKIRTQKMFKQHRKRASGPAVCDWTVQLCMLSVQQLAFTPGWLTTFPFTCFLSFMFDLWKATSVLMSLFPSGQPQLSLQIKVFLEQKQQNFQIFTSFKTNSADGNYGSLK